MKRNAILFAGLFAAALPLAASDKAVETQAAPAAAAQPAKPHSHVEEKTGVPQKAPVRQAARKNPAMDMSKHYHPRDGK
ncbi:MAG: hypothetical protein ROZ00_11295 [Denitratisoma sp.]|nr:hypothetical protein [Denitratisoma sp.]